MIYKSDAPEKCLDEKAKKIYERLIKEVG